MIKAGNVIQSLLDLKTLEQLPDSYVSNLRKEKRKKLTNPRVWLAVLAFVVVIYVAASHGVWLSMTSRLEHVNNQIVETEKRLAQLPPTN